jgi:hypothetical protein
MRLRGVLRAAVILFCLWHMTAVAVYSLPVEAQDPVSALLKRVVTPVVSPYLLVTSQWQQWNMFSPEPLHREGEYRIELYRDGAWTPLTTITSATVPWWRHGGELKMIRYLEDGFPWLRSQYLLSLCRPLGLGPNDVIRLVVRTDMMPLGPPSWSDWQPSWTETPTGGVSCALATTEHVLDLTHLR